VKEDDRSCLAAARRSVADHSARARFDPWHDFILAAPRLAR
jgi:hypothetical protein